MSFERAPPEADSARKSTVRAVVVTVSDHRTLENDVGGRRAATLLGRAGHTILERVIVPTTATKVRFVLGHWLARDDVDLILVGGGTGNRPHAPADDPPTSTIDVLGDLLEHRLDGFGELFRMLSFEEIGAAAMRSRALGGFAHGKVVFAVPGSPRAISLALERLILPEVVHLLREVRHVD